MIKLIIKELRLGIPRSMWLFMLTALTVVLPSDKYPKIISACYIFLAIFLTFAIMRDNRDLEFTLMLPVSRNDVAKCRIFDVVLLELFMFVALTIGVIISWFLYPGGNIVGIDSALAYLGIVLIVYAVFNAVFLPLYFRNVHKHGLPLTIALAASIIVYFIIEVIIQSTMLKSYLDSPKLSTFGYQSIVLAIGVIVFIIGTVVNCNVCVKIFNRKHG